MQASNHLKIFSAIKSQPVHDIKLIIKLKMGVDLKNDNIKKLS